MHENRRITQRVSCHYDLFSRTVRMQQTTVEHCLHSVNVGTVHRRKYVKWVWISWNTICFQNNHVKLLEFVFRTRTDWFWGPSSLLCSRCWEYSSWDMTSTTHLYLLPRMSMSGATTLLPLYAFLPCLMTTIFRTVRTHQKGNIWIVLCSLYCLLTLRRLMPYIYIYIWSTHSWCF